MGILDDSLLDFNPPSSLESVGDAGLILQNVWQRKYHEFGEDGDTVDLVVSLATMLDLFGPCDEDLTHMRYVCLALAVALAARPIVQIRFPEDPRPDKVIALTREWLKGLTTVPQELKDTIFPDHSLSPFMDADEAYVIYYETLRSIEKKNARSSILEILDDALTGEPITAYSEDRRKVLNWLLIEAVPAAYTLSEPAWLVTRNGILQNDH
jgi:hypothetical protein